MKQKNLLKIMALSAVALGSLSLSTGFGQQVQAAGVGTIDNPDSDSAVYVYDAPNGNVITDRTLANGSSWKIGQVVKVSGHGTWYEVGANVWINNYMMKVQGATDTPTNNTTNDTTHQTTDNTTTTGQIGTVKNPNGSANVYGYSAPAGDTITDPTYPVGSQWRITKVVSVAGQGNWYRIGTNVWLNDYVLDVTGTATTDDDQTQATPTEPTVDTAKKVITVAKSTPVYDSINGKATGQVLDPKTSWAYFDVQTINGATWYQVGGQQWLTTAATQTTPTQGQVVTLNQAAPLYNGPMTNGGDLTGDLLAAGTAWKVNDVQTYNGISWGLVGQNQWIDLSLGTLS